MVPLAFPKHLWEKVATDLFEFKGKQYLVVDDFSQYLKPSNSQLQPLPM